MHTPDRAESGATGNPPASAWRSHPTRGGRAGVAVTVLLLFASLVAGSHALVEPRAIHALADIYLTMAGVLLTVAAGLLTAGFYSLRYHLGASELAVSWLWLREVIPLARIDGVYIGSRLGECRPADRIGWSGYSIGTVLSETAGPVTYIGTSELPEDVVLVTTPGRGYAISPDGVDEFRAALIARLKAMPEELFEESQAGETEMVAPVSRLLRPFNLAATWTMLFALAVSVPWLALHCSLLSMVVLAGVATSCVPLFGRLAAAPGARMRATAGGLLRGGALVALLTASISHGLATIPVPIPDTYTSRGATTISEVNDWAAAGHTFSTDRDGLYRIDVALATLKRSDSANIQFYVREQPEWKGQDLRELRVELSRLPEGRVMDLYTTRWSDLPWATFEFEPIRGFAGKQLYFNIEGKDVPRENTVQVLFAYPNSYSRGQAYRSEKSDESNMVFRTYTRGDLPALLQMTLPLLAHGRPGLLGMELTYQVVAVLGAVATAFLFTTVARVGGHDS